MKIICTDKSGNDLINDILICESVSVYMGDRIVEFLNILNRGSDNFYLLVNDDYKLHNSEQKDNNKKLMFERERKAGVNCVNTKCSWNDERRCVDGRKEGTIMTCPAYLSEHLEG